MNFDYVSLRRLERFFTDLKAWLASKYATKDVATTSADGLMSSDDKLKLNGLETGAEVNTIESISTNGMALSPDINKNVDIPLATDEADGLLSATDKEKLDTAKSFSTVKVVESESPLVEATLEATVLNDTLGLVAGDNISLEAGLVIGGRQYKTVKIGNQVWMAENLDLLPEGIALHNEFDLTPAQSDFYEPVAWYYDFDEATAKERNYGLLYNSEAVDYLEAHKSTLFPGWHVPTRDELATLVATATRDSLRQSVSWAGGDWHNDACTNTTGFSAIPNGNVERQWRSTLPQFYRNGIGMGFWTITDVPYGTALEARRYYGNLTGYSYFTADTDAYKVGEARAIRLIKDDSFLPNKVRISSDAALEKSIYGDYIADESGQAVLGESGEQIVSESAVVLYDTFKGVKFGAARAVADQDGNVFGETYARKLLPATKAFAASVTVDNNRVTSITGVTGSVAIDITVAPGECANTAVELTTGSSVTADSSVTVTVNGVAAGRAAATDGKISASKKYQVTCVGTCWTMAEFETANA